MLPLHILRRYHFTFLIRHPRRAIPSYYRCCVPPLSAATGFDHFRADEAGYRELRVFLEFLLEKGVVRREELCVVDADDLLDAPEAVMRRYCEAVGFDFRMGMLRWGVGGDGCGEKFDKWRGFHEDAIGSVGLRPRGKVSFCFCFCFFVFIVGFVGSGGCEGANVVAVCRSRKSRRRRSIRGGCRSMGRRGQT